MNRRQSLESSMTAVCVSDFLRLASISSLSPDSQAAKIDQIHLAAIAAVRGVDGHPIQRACGDYLTAIRSLLEHGEQVLLLRLGGRTWGSASSGCTCRIRLVTSELRDGVPTLLKSAVTISHELSPGVSPACTCCH